MLQSLGIRDIVLIEAAELSLEYNGSPVMLDTPLDDRRRSGDRRRNEGGMPAISATGVIRA